MIKVEVMYARKEEQWLLPIELTVGSTIHDAIIKSGILEVCPEIDLIKQKVGIFSQTRNLDDKVTHGDRIEIYRPLLIDPKEARRKKIRKPSI
jgi:putative ubiquitin-RnfH superfamily antitoxin RatB of RatAB toxin-antitoxin module